MGSQRKSGGYHIVNLLLSSLSLVFILSLQLLSVVSGDLGSRYESESLSNLLGIGRASPLDLLKAFIQRELASST